MVQGPEIAGLRPEPTSAMPATMKVLVRIGFSLFNNGGAKATPQFPDLHHNSDMRLSVPSARFEDFRKASTQSRAVAYRRSRRIGLKSRNMGGLLMKAIASAAGIIFLLCASSSAQTLDDLKQDGNGGSTDNILTYGMGYHQHRYSTLKQID